MRTIGIGLAILGLVATAAAGEKEKTKPEAKKRFRPKVTISKETTWITEPVDADGFIDYAAALNRRLGRGIKPSRNATVLLWQALGPHPEGATMPREFFRLLGTNPLPPRGHYFIPLETFLKQQRKLRTREEIEKVYEDMQRLRQRPWTAKQYPHYAAWLEANEKPLAVVLRATRRPDYFSPLVPTWSKDGSSGLVGALMPAVQKCRELATALTARAQLRIGQGQLDDAWQDLLACHRLGRLVARGGTLIQSLVGFAIDNIASCADLALLDGGRLTSKQLLSHLRDLRKLPPMPSMADQIDL